MPIIGSLGAAASRGFGQFLQKITSVINTDAFFKYVTLLLTGNPPTSTFVTDASTNNFQVTIVGDTKPNNLNPYVNGYYSNYFDGTGDNLTIATNSAFQLGTGSYTFEAWINPTSLATAGINTIINIGTYSTGLFLRCASVIEVYTNNVQRFSISSSGIISTSTWQHIALVRNGSACVFYVNGVSVATFTDSSNISPTTATVILAMAAHNSSEFFTGYMSNARLVKGTAVYTSNFTPPTAPLTAISGTSLLTCQSNRFIDNSTNNFAITANGNTSVSPFDPFVPDSASAFYGSTYFDGTTDYLTAPNTVSNFGTGDFTIECWIYRTSTNAMVFSNQDGGSDVNYFNFEANTTLTTFQIRDATSQAYVYGPAVVNNVWNHIAVTRTSGSVRVFVNGVSGTAVTITKSVTSRLTVIGGFLYSGFQTYFLGYISNFRVLKDTALYTANFTPPTTPLTAITNTSLLTCQTNQPVNNNVFLDSSSNNLAVNRFGNTTQGSFNPYGNNWSVQTVNGGNLTVPANTALRLTGDFTIECWICPTVAINSVIVGSDIGMSSDYFGILSNRIQVGINNGTNLTWITNFSVNTWYHVALTRSSNFLRAFVDGTQLTIAIGNATNSGIMFQAAALLIGKYGYTTSPLPFEGNISNLRIVKGTALYTASFTPPTGPLTPVSGTSLLTCQSNRYVDNSPYNFAVNVTGTPRLQPFSPFSPIVSTPTSYSNFFDGTGDYLTTPANAAFGFGTGDFTVEFWLNFSIVPNRQDLVWWGVSGSDRGGLVWNLTTGNLTYYISPTVANAINYAWTPTASTWYHIALVRSSGSSKLYINGVQGGSTYTDTKNYSTSNLVTIGQDNSAASSYLTGNISNLRIVKGTAVYTANFTPPTSPLTAISGTSLLTCQSPTIIDNSTNNFEITVFGNVATRLVNPFGFTDNTNAPYTPATYSGSGYFDGTGDFLSIPTNTSLQLTGDFTVEAWVYPTAINTFNMIFGSDNGATSDYISISSTKIDVAVSANATPNYPAWTYAFTVNQWYHVAITRKSNTLRAFVNGVQLTLASGSATESRQMFQSSVPLFVGRYGAATPYNFTGYISNARIVKGTALYTSGFTPPITPLQAVTNTTLLLPCANGAAYDSSKMNDQETLGDAKVTTAITKFGNSSLVFDGTGDYLEMPIQTKFTQRGAYTIEFWIYRTSAVNCYVYSQATTNFLQIAISPANYILIDRSGVGTVITSTNPISLNQWTFVAFVSDGTNLKLFVDGVQSGSTVAVGAQAYSINKTTIGAYQSGGTLGFIGYIDDFRITSGYARYTQNFTVPTEPFPVQ